jgi:DNA polymerase-3 subunit alpha
MINYHIDGSLVKAVRNCNRFKDLSKEEHVRLYGEIKNATLQQIGDKLLSIKAPSLIDNDVNSLLLWVLEITDKYPEDHQKIKSTGSYADIDTDISKEKRDLVKQYLAEKYGEEKCADVVTFNTLAAKAAIRSAQRALGLPISLGATVAKHVPDVPGIKLQEVYDTSSTLRNLIKDDSGAGKIWEIALKLEGLPQALGSHASAYIVADRDLTNYVPLMVGTKKTGATIQTQFEYYDVEANGLIKFDLLGYVLCSSKIS